MTYRSCLMAPMKVNRLIAYDNGADRITDTYQQVYMVTYNSAKIKIIGPTVLGEESHDERTG